MWCFFTDNMSENKDNMQNIMTLMITKKKNSDDIINVDEDRLLSHKYQSV